MDLSLETKVAIVTGGSEGLGKAIALSLSKEGVRVAISGRREAASMEAAKETEEIPGLAPFVFLGDMTQENSVKVFVSEVVKNFDTVHILVNNVDRATRGLVTSLDHNKWQQTFDTNLMSASYAKAKLGSHH
jgi:NAD(P)-dependent dehydrogenase (short-subunit alcohol dehydrogenase family)